MITAATGLGGAVVTLLTGTMSQQFGLKRAIVFLSGFLMRIKDSGLEVLLCGGETAAEYNPGSFFPFGTGSYCETAIGLNTFVAMTRQFNRIRRCCRTHHG